MGVNVISWLWGTKYKPSDVWRLASAVKKQLDMPHRFYLFSDMPYQIPGVETRELEDRALANRSCFCRLRMFDPQWQRRNVFKDLIVSLDLDLVITGKLDELFQTESTFKILRGANAVNPCPFNASVMLLRPWNHGDVWSDFSIDKARAAEYHEFPDDQGWIWHKLPDADGWQVGTESGIYGFQKPGWPLGQWSVELPSDARIVAFIGKRKPSMYAGVPWIRKYWHEAPV